MIQEVDVSEVRDFYDPEGLYFIYCYPPDGFRYLPNFHDAPVLRCPKETVQQYKFGMITGEEFKHKLRTVLKNPAAIAFVGWLRSQTLPVYLIMDTRRLLVTINNIITI